MNDKIIKAWVYDPSRSLVKAKKSDPAIGHYYTCSLEGCEAMKNGMCFMMGITTTCKYGKHHRVYGKSQRASSFYSWMGEFREKYKEVFDVKLSEPKILCVVGDYIVLPYSYLHLNETIGDGHRSGFFSDNNVWIKKERFTAEFIDKQILRFVPRSFLGGVITDYQKEEVPRFLKHLMRFDSNLFNEVLDLNDEWKEESRSFSDIGRKAILRTLSPNVGYFNDIHGGDWTYDGEHIYCNNRRASFCLVEDVKEIRLKPKEDAVVVITDDKQVNDSTKFID